MATAIADSNDVAATIRNRNNHSNNAKNNTPKDSHDGDGDGDGDDYNGNENTSLLAAAENTAQNLEKKAERAVRRLLLRWDDLPAWRRDNAYILSGYRPDSNSYLASLRSLGYLHNESVNIWSHLLGAVVFLGAGLSLCHAVFVAAAAVAPRYAAVATPADVAVFACFFAGAVACLGMSATYHALSNHSPAVAKLGNKLDYSGIVLLIVGSYVPALYYGFFCHPNLMKLYLSIILLLGTACTAVSWLERFRTPAYRAARATIFVALGASGVVPVLHGLFLLPSGGSSSSSSSSSAAAAAPTLEDRMSLSLVVLHGTLYILGAVLYAARWPERSFPGAFDIWGSSHQIFHFFVVAAAATHLYAMARAFDFRHSVAGAQC